MSDNITLPRVVVQEALEALQYAGRRPGGSGLYAPEIAALRTHLAAEQPKPEPVAWQERRFFPKVDEWTHWYDCRPRMADYPREQIEQNGVRYQWRPLYPAPPDAPTVEESLTHPGYVIGNHWFETAYERLCAGEAEDAILEDYELVREPRLRDLRRDAERYKWALGWLVRSGLLSCETCRIDSPASYGNWWILRKPKVIDGSSLIGYGKTEDAAIDAAMKEGT